MNQANVKTSLRRPHRRGVVLIFVVAVLVLLALIGTAFLAMARIDRVYLDQQGGAIAVGSAIGGQGGDDLPGAVIEDLRRDVYDATSSLSSDTAWKYRPNTTGVSTGSYHNWDFLWENSAYTAAATAETDSNYLNRQTYDPYLASRAPLPYSGGSGGTYNEDGGSGMVPAWPVISRWVERWDANTWVFPSTPSNIGYFESPWSTTGSPLTYTTRHNAIPTWIKITYGATFQSPKDMQGKTRVFPALAFGSSVYLAADADGDGIADSGLFPLNGLTQFADTTLPASYYPGDATTHNLRWYAAIRVVDNTGAINVNTAWRRNVDLPVTTADTVPTSPPALGTELTQPAPALPNYGFFRSNIGLLELLNDRTADLSTEWTKLDTYKLGSAQASSVTNRADYVFTSWAEALEMNLGRRPMNPGVGGTGKFGGFDEATGANNAFLNGMVNPHISQTPLEKYLFRDLYQNSPNYGTTDAAGESDKESRSFTYFAADPNVSASPSANPTGPDLPLFWWNSLYNPNEADRTSYFSTNFPGYTPTARPVRYLTTTTNPQSTSLRQVDANTPIPTWITQTNGAGTTAMTPYSNTAKPKGSINTDPFPTLWRDFYETMADPTNSAAPVSADLGHGGQYVTVGAGTQDLLYLRSALAAVNAVDMRDADDDITTYRIRLPISGNTAMVAGTERQLFISHVDRGGVISVRLHNPYPSGAINGTAYRLAVMPSGGGSYGTPVTLTDATIGAGGDSSPVDLNPGPMTSGKIVLLRTRKFDGTLSKSADPNNPFDETATINDFVPVDMVSFDTTTGAYDRTTSDWTIACSGTGFSPGSVVNPVAIDNMPGPNKATSTSNNIFPFGAFARNGDMMLIPYAGTYAIYTGAALSDAVSFTLDVTLTGDAPSGGQVKARFTPPTTGTPSDDWRSRIFENFTTLANPMNDYFPNIAPESWQKGDPAYRPTEVKPNDKAISDEQLQPVHGLININTAPRDVLRMVPFVTDSSGAVDVANNNAVVQKILDHRRSSGPFASIVDLLTIPEFVSGNGSLAGTPTALQGNFMTDPAMATYASAYHSLIRVSNLVTTRSDSFIVYVVLQEWQDYGTAQPVLIPDSEQRFAAIVDRSQLNGSSKTAGTVRLISVPTE